MPSPRLMLARGAIGRCPECGSRGLFHGWFALKATCPGCGLVLQDEEGFFLGSSFINSGLILTVVAGVLIALMFQQSADPNASPFPLAIGGAIAAVVLPIVMYPAACTIWLALVCLGNWESRTPKRSGHPTRRG